MTTDKKERRIRREKKTIEAMVGLYCSSHHPGNQGLCESCRNLLEYSFEKLDKCPMASDKPTCLNCSIHCYSESRKGEVRAVMRYSGPRMLLRHPILSILHLVDNRRRRTAS